jgi:hypothetical protein
VLAFRLVTDIQGGAVAQLVEQRTENPCVGGSIPPHTTVKQVKAREVLLWLFTLFHGFYLLHRVPKRWRRYDDICFGGFLLISILKV